jgi:drug/metabolite transporter (DMT)-like permease
MTTRQWVTFLALTLIWGASFLWIKIAVRETGPLTIVTLRLALALVALLGILIARRPGFPRGARAWGVMLVQGLISTALPWILITWAEQYIDSALATVLNGAVPLFTIIIAHLTLSDDRMTRRRIVGLLVGFFGVLVLVQKDLRFLASGDAGVHMALLGQGAMILSSVFYAASNVYGRAKFRGVSPIYQAFYTMLAADAVMWIVTPAVESPFTLPTGPLTWAAIAWLGTLSAGLAYLLFYKLLHEIGPTRVATVTYTIPVVGVTLGVVFLHEALTWQLIVGTLLIVSGVWSVTKR